MNDRRKKKKGNNVKIFKEIINKCVSHERFLFSAFYTENIHLLFHFVSFCVYICKVKETTT